LGAAVNELSSTGNGDEPVVPIINWLKLLMFGKVTVVDVALVAEVIPVHARLNFPHGCII